ncbi:MAG: hypothetical protein LBO77_07670 [Desulfovibrio sp.]|nr:hypothetical protein [Desulfovibrio sp.]
MTALLADFRPKLERRLYAWGFTAPLPRFFLGLQLSLGAGGLLLGLPLAWYSLGPLAFGLGAAVMAACLWQTTRFVQSVLYLRYTPRLGIRFFLMFLARFCCIGLVLYCCLVTLKAPLAPLLLGLASPTAAAILWGIARALRKTPKEV